MKTTANITATVYDTGAGPWLIYDHATNDTYDVYESAVTYADRDVDMATEVHGKMLLRGNGTTVRNYKNFGSIWGSSNDGAGSGLDADTLDGIQASGFIQV